MEETETGIESQQEEVATSNLNATTGFAQALALATSESVVDDHDTIFPLEDTTGRSLFTPSTDENRPVEFYGPKDQGEGIIRFRRTGRNDSQGAYVNREQLEANFELSLDEIPVNSQINLVMANGKTLVGHTVKGKSRNGAYFPKRYAEQVLEMPPLGKQLPVRILSVIIG